MNFLDEIGERKREEVRLLSRRVPLEQILSFPLPSPPSLDLPLLKKKERGEVGVIGEFKRGSPSHGWISQILNPLEKISRYLEGGVVAVSILTDGPAFRGSPLDILVVRERYPSLPILRKDFIVDRYQVWESLLYGASGVLLIADLVQDDLIPLYEECKKAHLSAVVEIYDPSYISLIESYPFPVVGINTRNLKTLEVDLRRIEKIISRLPSDRVIVVESGILSIEDGIRSFQEGADFLLIGEFLMRSEEPERIIQSLTGTRKKIVDSFIKMERV